MDSHIHKAVQVLNEGGIVIFPTDTAYGIGCRMDNPRAIDRLFAIRNRPLNQATPVLVSSKTMAKRYYVHPHPVVHTLMDAFWPGALTIVSACNSDSVYSLVRGDTDTIGLRMPNHSIALSLISLCDVGILGPSANIHGHPTPFAFKDVNPELVAKADYCLEGECSVGLASTVISCNFSGAIKVIRQGAVDVSLYI